MVIPLAAYSPLDEPRSARLRYRGRGRRLDAEAARARSVAGTGLRSAFTQGSSSEPSSRLLAAIANDRPSRAEAASVQFSDSRGPSFHEKNGLSGDARYQNQS